MSYFLEQSLLFDQPIRLGSEERRDPFRVLESFFNDYRLHECRHQLWDMLECCLTSDDAAFGDAEDRAALLQWHKDLESLLEAAWLLVQQPRRANSAA
jgi:hypothetical protein